MGRIIGFRGNRHEQVQLLLPWYVTGRLDTADRADVEEHLANCAQCRAELAIERRLHEELARPEFDIELGWAGMRDQLRHPAALARIAKPTPIARTMFSGRRIAFALAAQVVLLIAASTLMFSFNTQPAYHTLGAAQTARSGNMLAVFRPETTEQALRQSLEESGARIADGPTAAGAYVLAAPGAQRNIVLAKLRKHSNVVMAEPLDPATQP
jgi:anti-sigma factor RsiW